MENPTDDASAEASHIQAQRQPGKRDAFAELLSPKIKQPKPDDKNLAKDIQKKAYGVFRPRDALGAYIANPESYPPSVVVYHNDDFVVLHDMFPKSSLHLLLLPRDPEKTLLHPNEAFHDAKFLGKVKNEVKKVRTLAAGELRRRYGKCSAQDWVRRDALDAEPPLEILPAGRNWEKDIMCGIHAHPSMNHLHVHILSVDRYSDRLKHRKHYNSFSTPFFVDINDFPLARDDPRRDPDRQGYLKRNFICWRCGRDFGNQFTMLKRHLEEEFDEWKRL
ncbi:HIT-like domain-containing protein [Aspergillus cavernicola]|uniref:HIT-like domain-containing protein n=1 Tax=Aspergillus cavernicola TaxID=176166 RepID=A0ABR4IPP9_9EURO